jgi:electron-transferring-flavoprotein dehydrogenase
MDDVQREVLDLDVVFVGAGPASLAGAYHLGRLIERHNAKVQTCNGKLEPAIAVLEKGKEIRAHAHTGAVDDPRALREIMPQTCRQAPY